VLACVVCITIRYDGVYLTCSKNLTGSQLNLPHGINKTVNVKPRCHIVLFIENLFASIAFVVLLEIVAK